MTAYYYKKAHTYSYRALVRFFAFIFFIFGLSALIYVFFPLLSWHMYFAPVFAGQDITVPIPKTTVVNETTIKSLVSTASQIIGGVDYINAENWFPTFNPDSQGKKTVSNIPFYMLSIPKLGIKNATVSTIDYDLRLHLINYGGTAIPPQKGNAVIFGHSTLPQLFNQNDYKTIFANAYRLSVNDEIFVTIANVSYRYRIQSITVVDPTDTSVLSQNIDNSYLTLVTCTPPGTIWKRLVIKAGLETI